MKHCDNPNKYCASARLGGRLATGERARLERARVAFREIGAELPDVAALEKCQQASATSVLLRNGLAVLVSYETLVAYRLTDGSEVATPHSYYSKTTDRSVGQWLRRRDCVRLEPDAFRERLRSRLTDQAH